MVLLRICPRGIVIRKRERAVTELEVGMLGGSTMGRPSILSIIHVGDDLKL